MTSEDRPESDIEADIRKLALALGWLCWKFVSPGLRGVPDRIFMRAGRLVFLEVKKVGEEPSRQQEKRAAEIRAAGFECYWVDNVEDARAILA